MAEGEFTSISPDDIAAAVEPARIATDLDGFYPF